ncbi:MAG: hypothetical protein WCS96_07915 [Victivallales bacterium]
MIETLKKLQELALRGVDGEKENAARKFRQLIQKYGINPDDLFYEIKSDYRFKYCHIWQKHILLQVFAKVTQLAGNDIHFRSVKGKKIIILNLSVSEYTEINFLYNEYSDDFQIKSEDFLHAYIQTNNIVSDVSTPSDKKYTLEEMARLKRIAFMSICIPKKEIVGKRLTA